MPAAFYARIAPAVQAATRGTPFFPSVLLAQFALESTEGKSKLSSVYHNYGGHKAFASWKGPTVRFATPNDAKKVSAFRVYKSFGECLAAHVAILQNPLYRRAQQAPDAYAQVAALASTYAEDPRYAQSLTNLMRQYNLTQYDPPGAGLLLAGLLVAAAGTYYYRADLLRLADSL